MTIAILCPTKGRPEQFKRMVESVKKTSYTKCALIYALGEFDYHSYGRIENSDNLEILSSICYDYEPTVHKWNYLAFRQIDYYPEAGLFMLAADDIIFATPGWDTALLEHYNALENKIHVYALQDSRDPEGTPHQIVTREWIEAMGWMCPPYFLHWYTDTWTTEIAKANGVFTHMKDYLLIHDKPSDRGEPDATHTGIRAQGWHERDKFVAEQCGYLLDVEKARLSNIISKWKIDLGNAEERN